jgi:gliding motility-associated-like protein
MLISNPGTACADTILKVFTFDGDSIGELQIPNVFTPNGDGLNDYFEIRGISWKCDEFHIKIYNRWGTDFFESYDPRICWNGKNEKGIDASEGVYFYLLHIKKHATGKEYNLHGTIELITGINH